MFLLKGVWVCARSILTNIVKEENPMLCFWLIIASWENWRPCTVSLCRLLPMGLFGAFLKLCMLVQIQDWGSPPTVLCGRPLLHVGRFTGKSCLCCSGTVWNCCIAVELLITLLKCGTEGLWKKGSDFRKIFFQYKILQYKLRLSTSR